MIIKLSLQTDICQSIVELAGVVTLGVISHKLIVIRLI